MTESSDYESVQVFIGVDVGKATHHAVAVNHSGNRLFDRVLPNDENKLRALISDLKQHGQILLVVYQPATIGALLVAVARTLPHALRMLKLADEQIAGLSMLCGFDDDLAAQTTQVSNRVRGLLTQIHPALERMIGPRLDHPAVLDLLQRYPSPEKLASLGEKKLATQLSKLAPRLGKRLAADITQALTEQTVVVSGTNAVVVSPRLALQLITLRKQRDEVALQVEQRVLAHPLYPVLTSMPGVGVRTAPRLLTEVACGAFASAAHFAAYAGLAPVTRRSDSSIRGEPPSRRGNKMLKRALFLSAFAVLRDPISRAYYTRKMSQGKRHNQALIALGRLRCDVLFAMMRDGTFSHPAAS
ncbi:transposase [Salmonella enterica subsp. enterica serovar Corvallis]|nr:transposase [Salmonella enterica subsp. enterica serovar Corvallis]